MEKINHNHDLEVYQRSFTMILTPQISILMDVDSKITIYFPEHSDHPEKCPSQKYEPVSGKEKRIDTHMSAHKYLAIISL